MNYADLKEQIERLFPAGASCRVDAELRMNEVTCERTALVELCRQLLHEWGFSFAGLIVEEGEDQWRLRYVFYGERDAGWVCVLVNGPLAEGIFPSIAAESRVFAADWHEREAEDLFGIRFEGHGAASGRCHAGAE